MAHSECSLYAFLSSSANWEGHGNVIEIHRSKGVETLRVIFKQNMNYEPKFLFITSFWCDLLNVFIVLEMSL